MGACAHLTVQLPYESGYPNIGTARLQLSKGATSEAVGKIAASEAGDWEAGWVCAHPHQNLLVELLS